MTENTLTKIWLTLLPDDPLGDLALAAIEQKFAVSTFIIMTNFWQLPFQLANQNARTIQGRDVEFHVHTCKSAFYSSCFWLASWKGSHQKVNKRFSKNSRKLFQVKTVQTAYLLGYVHSPRKQIKQNRK